MKLRRAEAAGRCTMSCLMTVPCDRRTSADAIQRRFLAVRDQAQEEFQRGETVSCDGWVLARSEAQLCAVAAVSVRRSKGI